jgi:hypothetical protein
MSHLNNVEPMYREVTIKVILADTTTPARDVKDAIQDMVYDREHPLWAAFVACDVTGDRTLTEQGCEDVLREMTP